MTVVFLDESGDTGFNFQKNSSRLFTACIVGFDSEHDYKKSGEGLVEYRRTHGLPDDYEIKFSQLNHDRRVEVTKAALSGRFWYYAFALNKPALAKNALRDKHQVYHKTCEWLFQNSLFKIAGSRIILDKCGNRDFYRAMRAALNEKCDQFEIDRVNGFTPRDSRHEAGLQIADIVAGITNRYRNNKKGGAELHKLLRARCESDRIWPKGG